MESDLNSYNALHEQGFMNPDGFFLFKKACNVSFGVSNFTWQRQNEDRNKQTNKKKMSLTADDISAFFPLLTKP